MLQGHGDDIYNCEYEIKSNFSSNIYGKQDLSDLCRFLQSQIHLIHSYPEPDANSLAQLIAEKNQVDKKNVCITNGATEAIYLIAQVFQKYKSAIIIPTFSEYEDACFLNKHQISFYKDMESIDGMENLVWLCNPNNPTGNVYRRDKLKSIIRQYSNTFFVLDQSYESLTGQSVLSIQEAIAIDNLILIHSMTKQYAIPGLRLGYITAGSKILKAIEKYKMPWSVNQMALEAGKYLIRKENKGLDISNELEETKRFQNNLKQISGLTIFPTETNFFLCQFNNNKNAADLKSFLIKKGILIRDASNFRGLDNRYFRLSTQSPEENDQLVQLIKEWI